MITKEQIQKLTEEALEGTDRFVVDVTVSASNNITVFIDADTDVCIDDCVNVSRHIESNLDRDVEDFELDVSSCGLSRPLLLPRQFQKYVEKIVEVKPKAGKKTIGKLISFNDEKVEIEEIVKNNRKKQQSEGNLVFDLSQVQVIPAVIF